MLVNSPHIHHTTTSTGHLQSPPPSAVQMADKKYATAWQGGGRQGARAGSSDGNAKYGFHNGSSSSKPRTGLDIWRPSLGATNRYVSAGSMGSDSDPDDVFPSPGCNRDYKADPPSHAMLPMPSLPALPALGSAGGFSAGDGDRETASEPSDHGSRGNSDGPEDIQALSLEEAIGPLGLDATAFVKALYEVTRQPPTVGYASADSQIPRFGTGAPLFMRDFYKASTNSGVFEPVSPAVYRRSLFPPTSPQKKRHQSHKVTEVSQHRMSRIDPSGLDLHRHFPPVKSLRLRDDDSNDSKAEIAFLSDLTIHASPAGHGWNCTPRQLVKVLVILNPRTLTDPTRSNLSGFWFTVQSNDIPTVEVSP